LTTSRASLKRYHLLPPTAVEGCYLAHALRLPAAAPDLPARHWPKGHCLSAEDCAQLTARGLSELPVIRPEPGDLPEAKAADRLGQALDHPSLDLRPAPGGRINLYARQRGVLLIDADRLLAFNRLSEALGLATLPAERLVEAGTLVASLKVVPFVVPQAQVAAGQACLEAAAPLLRVARFDPRPVVLIQTQLPQTKASVLAKTETVMRQRLERLDCPNLACLQVAHQQAEVHQALQNCQAPLVLLMGASAVCDRGDLLPASIEALGGSIEHFGMPVDPGNLLVLAKRPLPDGKLQRLIILPGCARSPQDNGTDIVLQRALADAPLSGDFLMSLGLGGLLKETSERGQAREAPLVV
jgi:molybdenum cofactor cytidylyltransferase